MTDLAWRKSSYSEGLNNCVEVAVRDDVVHVRDSKLGDASPVLTFTRMQWRALIEGVRAGEFTA